VAFDDFKYWAFVIIGKEPMCETPELGVVGMMVIVGTPPTLLGLRATIPKTLISTSRDGSQTKSLVLLVVINYEQPQQKQSGQDTARHPAGEVEVPDRARHGGPQEQRGRDT